MRILTRGLESLSEALATSGDVSLSSSVFHGGSHSLRTHAPGSNVAWARFGRADGSAFNLPLIYVRVWISLAERPSSGSEEILAVESAGGYKFWIRVDSQQKLNLFRADGATSIMSCPTVLALNTWYRIELMLGKETVDGAGNGLWALEINGQPEASGMSVIGAANSAYLRLGCVLNRSPGNIDCYFDDLAVDDANWPGASDPPLVNLAAITEYYRRLRCS